MVTEKKHPPLLVALDAEVFHRYHFNYNSPQFKILLALVRKEKIRLLITSITVLEVKRHINERAQLIDQIVKHYERGLYEKHFQPPLPNSQKVRIPTNSGVLNKFKQQVKELAPKLDEIKQELQNKFNFFLMEAKYEEIKSEGISVNKVFESYFSGTPPFSISEKKKYEFPDAFALLTLQKVAEERNQKIHIVSGDSDWENFCNLQKSTLSYFKNIDDLLEDINKQLNFKYNNECYKLYSDIKDEIIAEIKDKFPGLYFTIAYDFTIEWGSEEIQVEPNSVNVEIINSALIDINDSETDQVLAIFELEVKVNYNAIINYIGIDPIYNKEEDIYYYTKEPKHIIKKQSCHFYVETKLILSRDEEDTLCKPVIKDTYINLINNLGVILIYLDGRYDDED